MRKENQVLKATHAYVIVYFKDPNNQQYMVLNGREQALHFRAINQLKRNLSNEDKRILVSKIQSKQVLLSQVDGSMKACHIGRNCSGVLMIGRSALPGGGRDRTDNTITQTAIRELGEEFLLTEFDESLLEIICINKVNSKRTEIYYGLDLGQLTQSPHLYAQQHISTFAKTRKPYTEKRTLEILPLAQLANQLKHADDVDKAYMLDNMTSFAHQLCNWLQAQCKTKIDKDCREKLAVDLTEYQIGRELNGHVTAVEALISQLDILLDDEKKLLAEKDNEQPTHAAITRVGDEATLSVEKKVSSLGL